MHSTDRNATEWPDPEADTRTLGAKGHGGGQGGHHMPQKEHLPSVSDKEQKMYEHIKKSELEQGRSKDKAKAIAAATVVKHHNKNDHSSGR